MDTVGSETRPGRSVTDDVDWEYFSYDLYNHSVELFGQDSVRTSRAFELEVCISDYCDSYVRYNDELLTCSDVSLHNVLGELIATTDNSVRNFTHVGLEHGEMVSGTYKELANIRLCGSDVVMSRAHKELIIIRLCGGEKVPEQFELSMSLMRLAIKAVNSHVAYLSRD